MTLIKGIDPGLSTGIALYNLDTCKPIYVEETGNGIKGFRKSPMSHVKAKDCELIEHVVCEGFTLRSSNKFTADLSGVEIIGWLKGEDLCQTFPEPIQHMTITKLRKNTDDYRKSVITKMMKEAGFKIGAGHTRMALSVAVWYAAKVLKHRPTLELLQPKDS